MLAKPGPALAARAPELGRIAAAGPRAHRRPRAARVDLHADLMPILAATTCANLAAVGAGRAEPRLRVAVGRWLAEAAAESPAREPTPAEAIERSLAVGAGLAPPGRAWALGHAWRALYPAIVDAPRRRGPRGARLAGVPPAGRRDGARRVRAAAGQRRQAARARRGRPRRSDARPRGRAREPRRAYGAALGARRASRRRRRRRRPARPRARSATAGLLADLVADGHARIAPGRRGLDVDGRRQLPRRATARSPRASSAIGRPTEDSVIGNDTLSRTLHPHADRWARRVAQAQPRRRSPRQGARRARRRRHERAARGRRYGHRPARDVRASSRCPRASSPGRRSCAAARSCWPSGSSATDRRSTCIDPGAARAQRRRAQDARPHARASICRSSSPARPTRRSRSSTRRGRNGLGVDVASERELRRCSIAACPPATSS